jgi:membrane protein insertase Oxa1/YidC/SpoIIIJ
MGLAQTLQIGGTLKFRWIAPRQIDLLQKHSRLRPSAWSRFFWYIFGALGAFSLNVSVTATTSIGEGFEILRVTVGCFLLPNC